MQHNQHTGHGDRRHYVRLVGMIVLSFISMYILMYSMAHSFADVYNSFNQVYMAGLMTAPMVVIELWLMSSMYKDRKLNADEAAVDAKGREGRESLLRQNRWRRAVRRIRHRWGASTLKDSRTGLRSRPM